MTDKNQTRVREKARYAEYKEAFTDVFGDPFAKPVPIEGKYNLLRSRSSISATRNNFDEGKGTGNPARPNVIDFFCDAERIASDVLVEKNHLQLFSDVYILGTTESGFTPKQRTELEQRIGRRLLAYGLSPVSKYFTTVRQSTGPSRAPQGEK